MDGIDTPEEGDYEEGLEREGFSKPATKKDKIVLGAISSVLILLFLSWLIRAVF